jgi:DNA-binding Lrp family transcriptional regulator
MIASLDPRDARFNALSLRFMTSSLRLDALDHAIIVELQDNARASFATVGHAVGLSAPAVKRRVDQLLMRGVITGFTAIVDPRALGWESEAFVELLCSGGTPTTEVADLVSRHPEVAAAYTVTGEANAIVHLRTADTHHLEETLERIRAEPVVVQTISRVVLSRLLPRQPDDRL